MDRQRYISVPKNKKAMEAYDLGEERPEEMIEWKLTESEFNILYNSGVFHQLNEECDVIIDDFESEIIDVDGLSTAEVVILKLQESVNNKEIEHLYNLILEAIKNETLIAFDF